MKTLLTWIAFALAAKGQVITPVGGGGSSSFGALTGSPSDNANFSTTGGANKVLQFDGNGNLYLAPLVNGAVIDGFIGNTGNLVFRDGRGMVWAQADGAGNSIDGAGLTLFQMNFDNGHPGGGIMQMISKGNIGMTWSGGLQLGWADGAGNTFILTPSGISTAIDTKRESNPFVMPVNYWNGSTAVENRLGFQAVPVDTAGTVGFRFYKGVSENGVQDLSTRGTIIATLTEYGLDSAGTSPAFVTLDATTPVQTCVAGRTFQAAKLTLAGNRTLAINGAVAGMRGVIHVTRPTAGGAYTLTKPTSAVLRTGATQSNTGDTTDKWMWEYDGTYLTIDIIAGFPVAYNAADIDASAYIAVVETAKGSLMTNVQRAAIDSFILAEKAASRWTLHQRIYLPIWGVEAANRYDMKTATNVGTYPNGATHSSGYVNSNGTNQYFDFGVTPGALGLTNSNALVFALMKTMNSATNGNMVGCYSGANFMALGNGPGGFVTSMCTSANYVVGVTQQAGVWTASRDATKWEFTRTITGYAFLSNTQVGAVAGSLPAVNLRAMGYNSTEWLNNQQFGAFGASQYFGGSGVSDFTSNLKTLWETCTGLTLP